MNLLCGPGSHRCLHAERPEASPTIGVDYDAAAATRSEIYGERELYAISIARLAEAIAIILPLNLTKTQYFSILYLPLFFNFPLALMLYVMQDSEFPSFVCRSE